MDYLDYLFKVFDLDIFEQYCVTKVLEKELSGNGTGTRTVGDLVREYGEHPDVGEIYGYFRPEGKLGRFFFNYDSTHALWGQYVRLRSRMLDFLTGNAVGEDPAYRQFAAMCWPQEEVQDKDKNSDDILDKIGILARRQRQDGKPCLIGLCGPEGAGRRYHVRRFYQMLGAPLLILDSSVFSGDVSGDLRIADDILAECIFHQSGLMLCNLDDVNIGASVFLRLFEAMPVIFASAREKRFYFQHTDGFTAYWLEAGKLSYDEAFCIWQQAASDYKLGPDISLEEMPNKYTLTPGKIKQVMELAADIALVRTAADNAGFAEDTDGREPDKAVVTASDLREACHEMLARNMGKKVQRIIPSYRWDALVLPEYQKKMLMAACNQVRYKNRVYDQWGFGQKAVYGQGVSMVFSGSPGTGKTMAAQVIASELNMDLYRVELPSIVSKYIGETEKNLEEIFEQANASQVILFFDEADVLFSKRTEVKSSNDKYSNMEAAYLLQKMEAYDGITILSTNYLQNFDEAFKRRIKMIIDFPFPDASNRLEIWRQVIPDKMLSDDDIDFEYLARQFEFSGSNIKNAVLHGAFLAAAEGRAMTMQDLIQGVKNENVKIGKTLRPEDMGEYYMLF